VAILFLFRSDNLLPSGQSKTPRNWKNAWRLAQIRTKHVDPYRAAEHAIWIMILGIILIHIGVSIVLIAIERIAGKPT